MTDTLKYLRTGANLTKAQFAEAMGVPLRTYENLEAGTTPVRQIHMNAAYWALVMLAADSPLGKGFLPLNVAEVVRKANMDQSEKKAATRPPV